MLCQAVGWVVGFVMGDFTYTLMGWAAGMVLSIIVSDIHTSTQAFLAPFPCPKPSHRRKGVLFRAVKGFGILYYLVLFMVSLF